MATARKQRIGRGRRDEAEWLHQLLADVHAEVVRQPSRQAVDRIRARLLTEIQTPIRAAA